MLYFFTILRSVVALATRSLSGDGPTIVHASKTMIQSFFPRLWGCISISCIGIFLLNVAMLISSSLVPPLVHLCGSERPQHPTNPSMESELSRLSNRPGQCAVVFLPHSTTDFLGASSAPQWATYLKLHGFRSRAACQVVRSFSAKNLWSQNVLESQAVRPTCKRNLFETTFASSSPLGKDRGIYPSPEAYRQAATWNGEFGHCGREAAHPPRAGADREGVESGIAAFEGRNLVPTFPQRSPPSLLTTAACGGLRSTPDCRPRRAFLHLSYSYAPPCGPALLVTQCHLRTGAQQQQSLFNHLVGAQQEIAADSETERLGCFEIDHHFKFRRRLDRQVSGLRTSKGSIDVSCRATEQVDYAGAVRDQAAFICKESKRSDKWQAIVRGPLDDQFSIRGNEDIRHRDQPAVGFAAQGINRPSDSGCVMHRRLGQLHADRTRCKFERPQIKFSARGSVVRIEQNRELPDTRVEVLKNFHPFAAHRCLEIGEPSDVTSRPCKTRVLDRELYGAIESSFYAASF